MLLKNAQCASVKTLICKPIMSSQRLALPGILAAYGLISYRAENQRNKDGWRFARKLFGGEDIFCT